MKERETEKDKAMLTLIEGCRTTYKQSVYAFALAISGLLAVLTASISPEKGILLPYIGCSALMLFVGHLIYAKRFDREFSEAIATIKARESKAEPVDTDNPVNPPENSKNQLNN